jgi:hypothetical protein
MDLMSSSTTLAGPPMLKSSVETELLKDSPQEVLDHLAEMTPLRRLGRPEDIAAAVSLLVGLDGELINEPFGREEQPSVHFARELSGLDFNDTTNGGRRSGQRLDGPPTMT